MTQHHHVRDGDLDVHYVEEGGGPLVLLLHGFPQDWSCWRHVLPLLADRYTLVAPDLRGFGRSGRPLTGLDPRTAAGDLHRLIARLDRGPAFVVGHDWGAATGLALAQDHPADVAALAFLESTAPGVATPDPPGMWHPGFLMTADLPEALLAGREEVFVRHFLTSLADDPDVFTDDDVARYAGHLARPGGLRCALGYYRSIPAVAPLFAAPPLTIPVLALGGSLWGERVEETVRRVARDVTGGVVPGSGHWLPEEQPAEIARRLDAFLGILPADARTDVRAEH